MFQTSTTFFVLCVPVVKNSCTTDFEDTIRVGDTS